MGRENIGRRNFIPKKNFERTLKHVRELVGVKNMTDEYISFGKYGPDKGDHRKWSEVPDSYLEWLVNSKPGPSTPKAKGELFRRRNSGQAPIVDEFKPARKSKDSPQMTEKPAGEFVSRAEFNDVLFRLKRLEDSLPGDKLEAASPPGNLTPRLEDDDIPF